MPLRGAAGRRHGHARAPGTGPRDHRFRARTRRPGTDAPHRRRLQAVRRVVPARRDVRAAARGPRARRSSAGSGSAPPRSRSRRSGTARSTSIPNTPAPGCSRSCTSGRAADPRAAYAQVTREFRERFGVRWLPPLGFENTYAIAVRRETAERLKLHTLSDLARVGPTLRAGLTPDFIGRADGLPGLEGRLRAPVPGGARAAAGREVPGAGRGRGGRDRRLRDRRPHREVRPGRAGGRPPASFRPTRRRRSWPPGSPSDAPAAVAALTELSGRLTETAMRGLNRRVEVDGEPVARVAADALGELGLLGASGPGRRLRAWTAARGPGRLSLERAGDAAPADRPAPAAGGGVAGRRDRRRRSARSGAGARAAGRGGGHPSGRPAPDHPGHRPACVHDPGAGHRGGARAGGALPLFPLSRSSGTPTPACATPRRRPWARPSRSA